MRIATHRLIVAGSVTSVLLAIFWLGQQAWLVNPRAYQVQAQIAQAFRLQPLSAKRPDLINIVSHAKLRDDDSQSHYVIHGQIHNPNAVPLQAPSIVVQQIGADGRMIRQLTFAPKSWRQPLRPVDPNELAEFSLPITPPHASSNTPFGITHSNESWGYQLQLLD